jgi:transcription antitermination factor NusG
MQSWYVLHVRPQSEGLVTERIESAGIEAFYPHVIPKRPKGHTRDSETKFMPGYVFSYFSLAERTPIIGIREVVSILGFGAHAVPVPLVEIAAVKLITKFPELAMPCAFVHTGDRVQVAKGPLRGLEGFVVYSKSVTRVIVSVAMLGRSISAEVDTDTLEMLEPAAIPVAA